MGVGIWRTGVRLSRHLFAAALLIGAAAAPAGAASWWEKSAYLIGPRYDSRLPACNAYLPLHSIKSRFSTKEGRFWNSDLKILEFNDIQETALRPWTEGTIPRRYCSARALVSDGVWRPVYYSIIEDGGLIGASWGVQWCVVGIDRNWAYNPACQMAQP
jgi:hypothetical protein